MNDSRSTLAISVHHTKEKRENIIIATPEGDEIEIIYKGKKFAGHRFAIKADKKYKIDRKSMVSSIQVLQRNITSKNSKIGEKNRAEQI